ncbi:MAG: beta-ketoacyl-ACP synthase III [Peptococcaceae bacterium]|nr:beta-ketoacyl-ACP synthase III [Peptococcaceae bacterium]
MREGAKGQTSAGGGIQSPGLRILATGRALPLHSVTNEQLSSKVDTSDQWIRERTGIGSRYFCGEGESCLSLAVAAGRQALARSGLDPEEIGLCLAATFTPEYATPSTACLVQEALGLPEDIPAFDLNAACTGFLYALETARSLLIAAGAVPRPFALVIASEEISRFLDFTDRGTCVLFGDGAAAAVVSLDAGRLYRCLLGSRGTEGILSCPGVGKEKPKLQMQGKEVFRFAVDVVPRCIRQILEACGLTLAEIDYVVCHQANRRIIDHVVKKLAAPPEKFYCNVAEYGNTSAASIPIALDEMAEKGLLRPGMVLLCVGFGAGLTWGATLLEW